MKYKLDLVINKPRNQVWQAFNDPEKLKAWQPSLIEVRPLSGVPGQPGAESKLTFTQKERKFSLVETITQRQELECLEQRYENQFATNTVRNLFAEQGKDQTLWTTETEYRFKTFLMKVMVPLYRKNLVTRTRRDMERFKEMIESA